MDEDRFNFFLRVYVNDCNLMVRLGECPETVPHVSFSELKFEMDTAWEHLEEMIPDSHIQAIYDLL